MTYSTIFKPQINIRPALEEDRQQLANLIHFEAYVHRHLDWRTPLDWIGAAPYLLLEQHRRLQAALVCPPDPPSVAWIRLFAATGSPELETAWEALWAEALAQLQKMEGVRWAAALALWPWFVELLSKENFTHDSSVVLLNWQGKIPPEQDRPKKIGLRPMRLSDIPAVEIVDVAAFEPLWQNSQASLEMAFRQAAIASVAELDGQMVGYQISTVSPAGGHLARLAVLPGFQGRGIGYGLVYDLLAQFNRDGVYKVSVNTQQDNITSLNLYRKAGFFLTGEEYPLYVHQLHANSGQSGALMGKFGAP
jgi:ribosomal protein S18 acetylase RimI-like enzyme